MDATPRFERLRKLWQRITARPAAPLPPAVTPDLPPAVVGGGWSWEGYSTTEGIDYRLPPAIADWMLRLAKDSAPVQRVVKSMLESFDPASTYNTTFGAAERTPNDAPFAAVYEDPLKEWNWSTREVILSNCHNVYHRNPLANAIVEYTSAFSCGDGFNLVFYNDQVKAVLMEFIEDPANVIRQYERQAFADIQVDGELVLQLYRTSDGRMTCIPRKPWELHSIKTELGNFRRPTLYEFQRFETQGDSPSGDQETVIEEALPANIIFAAINRHSYELRGRPELYRLLRWLQADAQFLEDRAMRNKFAAAAMWHIKVGTDQTPAKPEVVSIVRQHWTRPFTPGSNYVSPHTVTVDPITAPMQGADAAADGQMIRRMVILGSRMAEYFFADGSNANRATATKQEMPSLTRFEGFQQTMIEQMWTPLFTAVIAHAIDTGRLSEMVYPSRPDGTLNLEAEPIETLKAYTVSYEPITAQDMNALLNVVTAMQDRDYISRQTAIERMGFDPEIESERQRREAELAASNAVMGNVPFPITP